MIEVRHILASAVVVLAVTGPMAACVVLTTTPTIEGRTKQIEAMASAGATPFQIACVMQGSIKSDNAANIACIEALRR